MTTNNTKLGSELSSDDQKRVLAAYIHRFTGQHKPRWAKKLRKDGTPFPVQFKDDAEWLAHTQFSVTSRGKLDNRFGYCQSNPTWPENPELRS